MYLLVVEAEGLTTTCHYCERVLKQGCRCEESFGLWRKVWLVTWGWMWR